MGQSGFGCHSAVTLKHCRIRSADAVNRVTTSLRRLGPGVLHANAVERRAGRDEQRLVVVAAEADVGGAFGHVDLFQQLAVGVVDVHLAVRRVEVALHVDRHAVAPLLDCEELLAELAFFAHFVAVNAGRQLVERGIGMLRVAAGVGDVEPAFVGREVDAVGHREILDDGFDLAGLRIELEDPVAREFAAPVRPHGGSVNQSVPSERTATSFGELNRLPSNLSASTVMLPSVSVRTRLRPACWHEISRPSRSRMLPFDCSLLRKTDKPFAFPPLHQLAVGNVGEDEHLLAGIQTGPSVNFMSPASFLHLLAGFDEGLRLPGMRHAVTALLASAASIKVWTRVLHAVSNSVVESRQTHRRRPLLLFERLDSFFGRHRDERPAFAFHANAAAGPIAFQHFRELQPHLNAAAARRRVLDLFPLQHVADLAVRAMEPGAQRLLGRRHPEAGFAGGLHVFVERGSMPPNSVIVTIAPP